MSKGLSAEEIVDLIEENKAKAERDAYPILRSKCIDAVNSMVTTLVYGIEVEILSHELPALTKVTEDLRDLGYKFRFIEIQDAAGESQGNKLHISVDHAR